MESNLLIYFGIIILLFLTSAVLFLVAIYSRLAGQFESLRTQRQRAQSHAHQEATQLIEDAKKRSLEILGEAEHKAKEIIASTDFFQNVSKDALSDTVKKASIQQSEEYVAVLNQLKKEVATQFQSLSQHVQEEALKEITEFRQNLDNETKKSETALQSRVDQEYQQSGVELAALKQKMIDEMKANVFEIVKQTVRQVAHKTLTASEHEALVLQALEEAKAQHEF